MRTKSHAQLVCNIALVLLLVFYISMVFNVNYLYLCIFHHCSITIVSNILNWINPIFRHSILLMYIFKIYSVTSKTILTSTLYLGYQVCSRHMNNWTAKKFMKSYTFNIASINMAKVEPLSAYQFIIYFLRLTYCILIKIKFTIM